jgi:hypothetical protein
MINFTNYHYSTPYEDSLLKIKVTILLLYQKKAFINLLHDPNYDANFRLVIIISHLNLIVHKIGLTTCLKLCVIIHHFSYC